MKILFTGVYSHLYGGLERFAERAAAILREAGHVVDTAGDVPDTLDDRDFVLMQKIPKRIEDLRRLKERYGEKLRFYAHDHELYCLRRHYYDPMRRLCDRTYSFLPCRACAAVTRPQWVLRNVTRDIKGFIAEMRGVKAFVPSNYIKANLVKNGFDPNRVKVLYPLFTHPHREEAAKHEWMAGGELRILFMGQLIAGKGVGMLIDAVNMMKKPCRLSVAGTGRDEAKLRKRASERIEFLGWREGRRLCRPVAMERTFRHCRRRSALTRRSCRDIRCRWALGLAHTGEDWRFRFIAHACRARGCTRLDGRPGEPLRNERECARHHGKAFRPRQFSQKSSGTITRWKRQRHSYS